MCRAYALCLSRLEMARELRVGAAEASSASEPGEGKLTDGRGFH